MSAQEDRRCTPPGANIDLAHEENRSPRDVVPRGSATVALFDNEDWSSVRVLAHRALLQSIACLREATKKAPRIARGHAVEVPDCSSTFGSLM